MSKEDFTLFLVLQHGVGNLANTLNSVRNLTDQIVVVDATESPGKTTRFLVSEFDGKYIALNDADESVLLNHALGQVQTEWALFMKPEEILHHDDLEQAIAQVAKSGVDALEVPVIRLSEPSNYHFEIRLIRRSADFSWTADFKLTLWDVVTKHALDSKTKPKVALWNNVAVVSLGEPNLNTAQLEAKLNFYRQKLDESPDSVVGWYQRARVAQQLEDWDEQHDAVEAGFKCMVGDLKSSLSDAESMNGLTGMFCEELVRADFKSEKTTESLWQILQFTSCDGRFSVPLGYQLIAQDRSDDAKFAQFKALKNFVDYRRYYLPMKECLLHPALLLLELEAKGSDGTLLQCLIKIQDLIGKNSRLFPAILTFISENQQSLYGRIKQVLKASHSGDK